MNDLLYKKLEDICLDEKRAIISGPFGSNISSKYFVDKGIPVIRGNNLSLSLDKFYDEGFVYVTKKKADELNCYAKKLDIIFTAAGTIGQVGLITNDTKYDCYVISNKQIRARLDPNKIDILYAYYWFTSPWIQKYLTSNNKGSTVPLLSLWEVKNLPIIYPKSMSKQKKISNIIDKISKKIELNNKINDELEVMAKTVYDYWFLQFEFPNEEGKPYKSSGGKMVWNDELKREIPEGWDVQTLENLGNLIMGQSPKSTSYNNKKEGLPLINGAAELQKDKIEITKYTSEPTRICKKEDLIFCIRATIGNINYADKSYCLGRGVGAFRVTEKEYVEYMFLTLRNILNMYNKILTGSIIVGITKEDLLQQNIIKPKNDVITQFYNKVHFMAEKMKSIKKENQELTSLRDFLLPLLMNGQVGFKGDKAEG